MSKNRILSRSVATLLALSPCALHAGIQMILPSGDPTDGTAGAIPKWGVATNWSGTNGAALPGVNDLAQIFYDGGSVTGVDISGSDFTGVPPNFTEVQGLSFTGPGFATVVLENNSTTNDMTLALNGGGGAVPLIQTGDYTVEIDRIGLGTVTPTTKTLTLQLKGNGDINVGGGGLTISAVIAQSGGAFGFNKTGFGTLTLSGTTANTYAGTTTISEGTLVANKTAGVNAIGGNLVVATGGTFLFAGNNVGNQIANTATVTLNGGDFGDLSPTPTNPGAPETVASLVVNSGNFSTGRALFTATGVFTAAGGTTLIHRGGSMTVGTANISGGSVNLDGGSTTAGAESKLTVGAGGMTLTGATVNFNVGLSGVGTTSVGSILSLGGNLTATGVNNFVHVDTLGRPATLTLGGPVRTFNITGSLDLGTPAAPVVVSTGGISKTGTGTLTLNGTNTLLNGAVTISAGKLVLNGSIGAGTAVAVQGPGAFTLNGSLPAGRGVSVTTGGVFTAAGSVSTLTLGLSVGDTSVLNLQSGATLAVTTNNGLISNGGPGKVTINIVGAVPGVGQYAVLDYAGTIGGSGFSSFVLGSLPSPRLTANLTNNTTNTSLQLNVTGLDFPIWKGSLSSEWSTATLGNPKNWVLNSNNATTTDFLPSDAVVFNDLAANTTVDVSIADVFPSAVTFSNTTNNFTLNGSKAIAGTSTFSKSGGGTLTINNINSFTGLASLNGGTVKVASIEVSGTNSPLGAGTAMSFNGGTLEYTGGFGFTDRAITLNAGGGTVKSDAPITLAGPIGGTGTLTKVGANTLILTGANTYGGTTISGGTVQVGDNGTSGSLGTGPVVNNGVLVFTRSDNALTVPGAISGSGPLNQFGVGTTTLTGTTANTYAGLTTVSGGVLAAGKTAGVNAIPGDLLINGGGSFRFMGNNVSNQIADTATITITDNGTFGDPVSTGPTSPGATDTVANVNVNGGTFNSGRNDTLSPFTITGLFNVTAGSVLVQRGGGISAGTLNFTGGFLDLDGGSTTAGQESKLIVGAGGLTMTGTTINLNAGPSALGPTSVGSIVTLNGNLTSTGSSIFNRLNSGIANATLNLGGGVRTFNVTGSLDVGSEDAPITLLNGGINKTGTGTLTLSGAQNTTSLTNSGGMLRLSKSVALTSLNLGAGTLTELSPRIGGPGAVKTIDTQALTFTGNGTLDLTNNAMVVRGGSLTAINAKLASGFNGFNWNGSGINSSSAAADAGITGLTAVGVINNADFGLTSFAGVNGLTGNEILVKYTYLGDADLNGVVNVDDFNNFAAGFNHEAGTSPYWFFGDFDYNGVVNVDDFGLFASAFTDQGGQLRGDESAILNQELGQLVEQIGLGSGDSAGSADLASAASQAVVPEPGSIGLLAVGAFGLLARRRRR